MTIKCSKCGVEIPHEHVCKECAPLDLATLRYELRQLWERLDHGGDEQPVTRYELRCLIDEFMRSGLVGGDRRTVGEQRGDEWYNS